MFERLRRLWRRFWRRLRPRADAEPRRWIDGRYRSWRGVLFYAPWVTPARDYRLYIPAGYRPDADLPLLVMLHGCRQDPDSFAAGTGMNRLADEYGFLVLYPHQRQRSNPYRCWNWFDPWCQRRGGEAALVAGIADEIARRYAVDPRRIYAAGLSAGGALAAILAVCYPDRFAAVAVHAGLPYAAAQTPNAALRVMREGADPKPAPYRSRATPAVLFHGDADDVVIPLNAERLAEQLRTLHQRDGALERQTETIGAGERYGYTLVRERRGDTTLLASYRVRGLGHAWSGGDAALPYNDPRGPDASRLSWAFLSAHRL